MEAAVGSSSLLLVVQKAHDNGSDVVNDTLLLGQPALIGLVHQLQAIRKGELGESS